MIDDGSPVGAAFVDTSIIIRYLTQDIPEQAEIARQIQKTLEHEIGHYFGLSERDLRRRGY